MNEDENLYNRLHIKRYVSCGLLKLPDIQWKRHLIFGNVERIVYKAQCRRKNYKLYQDENCCVNLDHSSNLKLV